MRWKQLWELLPDRRRKGRGWEPALPLTLAAWWDTPILMKKQRLREHVEWAETHGALDEALEFMRSLPEDDWYHGE